MQQIDESSHQITNQQDSITDIFIWNRLETVKLFYTFAANRDLKTVTQII